MFQRCTLWVFHFFIFTVAECNGDCTIPHKIRGAWFSWENGQNTLTEIDANSMTGNGYCVDIKDERLVNYTIVFKRDNCFTCVKFQVRTVNILEKIDSK